jgi:hypothetical protein
LHPDRLLYAALRTNSKDIWTRIIILKIGCLTDFVASSSNVIAAKFPVSKTTAKHGRPFGGGEFVKEAWMTFSLIPIEVFQNNDKFYRVSNPSSRNTHETGH